MWHHVMQNHPWVCLHHVIHVTTITKVSWMSCDVTRHHPQTGAYVFWDSGSHTGHCTAEWIPAVWTSSPALWNKATGRSAHMWEYHHSKIVASVPALTRWLEDDTLSIVSSVVCHSWYWNTSLAAGEAGDLDWGREINLTTYLKSQTASVKNLPKWNSNY